MVKYDHHLRIGDFDFWVSSNGNVRAEKILGGERGLVCYKAKFIKSEQVASNILKLFTNRRAFQLSVKTSSDTSQLPIKLPKFLIGTALISGVVPTSKAMAIYNALSEI